MRRAFSAREGQKQKNREPSLIMYPTKRPTPKGNSTAAFEKNKKAQDQRKVRSDLPKGKVPQGVSFPKRKLAPKLWRSEEHIYASRYEKKRGLPGKIPQSICDMNSMSNTETSGHALTREKKKVAPLQ
uniref:Uncharacterized protein n=1 Tax=Cannabis sativa TaxID=3483 RepID=A0A803NRA2_CANSA